MSKKTIENFIFKFTHQKMFNKWFIFVIDLVASILYTLLSYEFLTELTSHQFDSKTLLSLTLLSLVVSFATLIAWHSHMVVVRHTTLRESWRIILSIATKQLVLYLIIGFSGLLDSSIQLFFICSLDTLITVVALFLMRIVAINTYHLVLYRNQKNRLLVLIYSIYNQSITLTNAIKDNSNSPYYVKGFLQTATNRKKYNLINLPVYHVETTEDLQVIRQHVLFHHILFANDNDARNEQEKLIPLFTSEHIKLLVMLQLEEMVDGKLPQNKISEIQIEDLLGRDEINIDLEEIEQQMGGKVIMVTGAAGSIGSELCRQLITFGIKELVLFDMAETPMHNLQLELEEKHPTLRFTPIVGDVRSEARVAYVFERFKPQIVFHAAAYKHVPLMENNPCEAVLANVCGTRNVADQAVKYGVERFVMVSTDKAVNPTNVMGCSKRLAEIYIQSLGNAIKAGTHPGNTKFITTRFGNVLGSNGSVIPRFREQIKQGGPITVTHPDIIRYFMTIPEACRLVLEAATLGNGSEIFIFDMGEAVKIVDLARNMIKLAGLEPDSEIKIEFTGLRPGEKLYEEMLNVTENTSATNHQKIRIATVRNYDYSMAADNISQLHTLCKVVNIPETVRLMKRIVPEFISKNSIYEKFDKEIQESKENKA